MINKDHRVLRRIYCYLFVVVLAILPMSDTIALRNLLLFLMLAILVYNLIKTRADFKDLYFKIKYIPSSLILWCLFLIIFPIWSVDPHEAWRNFRGQWGESILTWIIGFGAVWIMGLQGPSLWTLACASAFPVYVHLIVFSLAWTGLLGVNLPNYLHPLEVWQRLWLKITAIDGSMIKLLDFPLGFSGIEPMHGNLGYASCQAICIFTVLLLLAYKNVEKIQAISAVLAITLCLFSLLAASSRGAFLYSFIILIFGIIIYNLKIRKIRHVGLKFSKVNIYLLLSIVLSIGLIGIGLKDRLTRDIRWQTMLDKVQIGLLQDHPERVLCDGLTTDEESRIRQQFSNRSEAYVDELINGLKIQDGARIMLMRVGIDMVLQQPIGLDGGRSSYTKLMEIKCQHAPALYFAHLHQSWMDLSLALGWLGVTLFAAVLIVFTHKGWKYINLVAVQPWAFALFLLSLFWFFRGFADSLYREHYLQMQALLLSYLFGRMILSNQQKL